jgi:hypothetical protein
MLQILGGLLDLQVRLQSLLIQVVAVLFYLPLLVGRDLR